MFKRFPFTIGFAGGVLVFLALNVDLYRWARGGAGENSVIRAGFPVWWYTNA